MRADSFGVLLPGLGHELAGFQDGSIALLDVRADTKDVPANSIAGGNPAKVIRMLDGNDEK